MVINHCRKFEVVPKNLLWCNAVGISNVEIERVGCFGGGDCAVDLVPLGLFGDTPPGRPRST